MKSAYFSYTGKSKRTLRGKVTLKDDGKISVNLIDARMCSSNERYQAKMYAEKVAKDGFIDPTITNIEEINIDQKLIDVLRTETQSLKNQYIQFTKNYATKKFEWATKIWSMGIIQLYEHFNIEYKMVSSNFRTKDGDAMRPQVDDNRLNLLRRREMDKQVKEAREIHTKGYDIFEANEVKFAERHYEDSLTKLAQRIETKGLDSTKLKVSTAHIGVNFNATLTDGTISVRAFTVIAQGPIQRPHYRYLIK